MMFIEMLSYPFMQRAFVTGIFVAIACSFLGTFLVLRKYSMIGDGLAHISFGGVAAGILFGINPVVSALLFAFLGALGILKLKDSAGLQSDNAIGLVSHVSLGIGIFIASAANGLNVDIMSYLFGSILAIKASEMAISVALATAVMAILLLFYWDFFYLTFSEESAKVGGIKVGALNTLLVLLTAATIVISMKVVGILLASALIILPASSALQLKTSFKKTLFFSAGIAIFSVICGLVVAYRFDFAASGTVVIVNALIFSALALAKGARLFEKNPA